MSSGLSAEVERLITEHIHSVYQLEVLLLLRRTAPQDWNAQEVAGELRTSESHARSTLEDLERRALIQRRAGAKPHWRYYAGTPERDEAVAALAHAYAERHLSVIHFIFTKPPQKFERSPSPEKKSER